MKLKMIFALIAFSTNAYAYIPPSFYIVRHIAKKHSDLSNISIKTRIKFLNSSGGERSETLNEHMFIDNNGLVNISIKNEAGTTVARAVRKITDTSGKIPFLYDLIFTSDSALLFTRAKNIGFELKTETQLYADKSANENLPYEPESNVLLEKEGSHITLTLGGNSKPGAHPPKLWLDKSNLLPQRALYRTESGDLIDVRFRGYAIHNGSFYPRRVDVSLGDTPWVRLDLVELKNSTAKLSTQEQEKISDRSSLSNELENYLGWIR